MSKGDWGKEIGDPRRRVSAVCAPTGTYQYSLSGKRSSGSRAADGACGCLSWDDDAGISDTSGSSGSGPGTVLLDRTAISRSGSDGPVTIRSNPT